MSGAVAAALPGGCLEVRVHSRKGRSLHTTRHVKGGEVVLAEEPVLLLVSPDLAHNTCSACLKALGPQEGRPCSGCNQACFCSVECLQLALATPWLHSGAICSAYVRLAALRLPAEEHSQLRFLLHALALRHTPTSEAERRFAALINLVGEPKEADMALAARLAPLLSSALEGAVVTAPPLDVRELAALLRKEQLNSYGILAAHQQTAAATGSTAADAAQPAGSKPACSGVQEQCAGGCGSAGSTGAGNGGGHDGACHNGGEEDGERRLRGSALYAQASLINHECLPNIARFDYFDSDKPDRTHIVFRALHDLPAGTELAQSYVPLHWGLADRQAQCREVYGFSCTCPRCQTESQWSDDEASEWETDSGDGDMGDVDNDDGTAGDREPGSSEEGEVEMQDVVGIITAPDGQEGPLEPNYLRLFLLKYVCARAGCLGTAAPVSPGSPLLECSVCNHMRSEQDFLRELEKTQRDEQMKSVKKR